MHRLETGPGARSKPLGKQNPIFADTRTKNLQQLNNPVKTSVIQNFFSEYPLSLSTQSFIWGFQTLKIEMPLSEKLNVLQG